MITLLAACLFGLLIVVALYAFGWFNTQYLTAFRFAFYLVLLLFAVVFVFGLIEQPYKGYDPTVQKP